MLLFTILFNSIGSIGAFLIERHQAQKMSEFKITHLVDLLLVCIEKEPASGPRPVLLNKHELRYKGRVYDIVYKRISGHKTRYYALPDEFDTQTFNRLNQEVQWHSTSNKDNHHLLLTWIKLPWIPEHRLCSDGFNEDAESLRRPSHCDTPHPPYLTIPTPPPRLI